MGSAKPLSTFTSNLGLFGCYVITGTPLPKETKVTLRILRGDKTFATIGKVVYSRPKYGMGIAFTGVEPNNLAILEEWLASLRTG